MIPIVVDPEPAVSGAWTMRAVLEALAAYLVAGAVGWLISQVGVGRRLKRSDTLTAKHLNELRDEIKELIGELKSDVHDRMAATDHAVNSVAQEVWGAQQTNGLRSEVKQLRDESAQHARSLAKIDAKLEILLTRAV